MGLPVVQSPDQGKILCVFSSRVMLSGVFLHAPNRLRKLLIWHGRVFSSLCFLLFSLLFVSRPLSVALLIV